MITSVMSIHASIVSPNGFGILCSWVPAWAGASSKTGFKISREALTGLSSEEESMPTGRVRTGGRVTHYLRDSGSALR
jgi:hypothetical protein